MVSETTGRRQVGGSTREAVWPRCQAEILRSGPRRRCTRRAKFIARAPYKDQLVCGIHKRGWLPDVLYLVGHAAVPSRV